MAYLEYNFKEKNSSNNTIISQLKEIGEKYGIGHQEGYFYKKSGDVLMLNTMLFDYFINNPADIDCFESIYFIDNGMYIEDLVVGFKKLFDKKGINYARS